MKRFIRSDGSINQINLQIWLRKPSIRTVFVELQCIYNHCSTYFQPLIQRYIARFSKNKVRKEHLRFNCEGDITLRFPTGFNGSVWNLKDQCAYTFDFDHNRNLYLLDYSLGLMIEIYSRDVSMSQLSTFISIVEEFQSYKTWQYLLTHQGLLFPLSLRIRGNNT